VRLSHKAQESNRTQVKPTTRCYARTTVAAIVKKPTVRTDALLTLGAEDDL